MSQTTYTSQTQRSGTYAAAIDNGELNRQILAAVSHAIEQANSSGVLNKPHRRHPQRPRLDQMAIASIIGAPQAAPNTMLQPRWLVLGPSLNKIRGARLDGGLVQCAHSCSRSGGVHVLIVELAEWPRDAITHAERRRRWRLQSAGVVARNAVPFMQKG